MIFGKVKTLIDEKKAAFSKAQNERSASRLQKLKSERVKQEGKARLASAELKERKRITKAKDTKRKLREERFKAVTKNFKTPSDAAKKKDTKLGNGLGNGINPAFGLGKK